MPRPRVSPFASRAPLFAASIIPGPPPDVTINRLFWFFNPLLHFVSLNANSRAAS